MTSPEDLDLTPAQLAFIFDSELGVDAQDLGVFLQRAATVARRAGGDIYVVGLQQGSLAVIGQVLRRGIKASIQEFKSSPIRTTGSGLGIVGAVAGAIATAMHPHPGAVTPLAKSGAALIQNRGIAQISLITINRTEIIMDEQRAAEVKRYESAREVTSLPSHDVRQMMASARQGLLAGTFILAGDELHFRPDGFRYLVPVQLPETSDWHQFRPDRHVVIWGELLLRDAQPDLLVIREVRPE